MNGGGAVGHNFERDPPRDHTCQVWFNLVQRFQSRKFKNVIFYQNMPNLHNRYKSAERKISQNKTEYKLNCSLPCSCSQNLSSFWLILKQQWTIKEISIFSNRSHLEWGWAVGHNFERDPPRDHPCQVWFNLVQRFQRRKLKNVIFYQNMPNLHNQYQSAERKISQKNPEYMLNYSLPCSCS